MRPRTELRPEATLDASWISPGRALCLIRLAANRFLLVCVGRNAEQEWRSTLVEILVPDVDGKPVIRVRAVSLAERVRDARFVQEEQALYLLRSSDNGILRLALRPGFDARDVARVSVSDRGGVRWPLRYSGSRARLFGSTRVGISLGLGRLPDPFDCSAVGARPVWVCWDGAQLHRSGPSGASELGEHLYIHSARFSPTHLQEGTTPRLSLWVPWFRTRSLVDAYLLVSARDEDSRDGLLPAPRELGPLLRPMFVHRVAPEGARLAVPPTHGELSERHANLFAFARELPSGVASVVLLHQVLLVERETGRVALSKVETELLRANGVVVEGGVGLEPE